MMYDWSLKGMHTFHAETEKAQRSDDHILGFEDIDESYSSFNTFAP